MTTSTDVALVTGASRGIGQAIAASLAATGAAVIGTATTPEGAARSITLRTRKAPRNWWPTSRPTKGSRRFS